MTLVTTAAAARMGASQCSHTNSGSRYSASSGWKPQPPSHTRSPVATSDSYASAKRQHASIAAQATMPAAMDQVPAPALYKLTPAARKNAEFKATSV